MKRVIGSKTESSNPKRKASGKKAPLEYTLFQSGGDSITSSMFYRSRPWFKKGRFILETFMTLKSYLRWAILVQLHRKAV